MALGLAVAQGLVLPHWCNESPPCHLFSSGHFRWCRCCGLRCPLQLPAADAWALLWFRRSCAFCPDRRTGRGLESARRLSLAALSLGIADRTWLRTQSPRGSILAVVGCIPMVPGSLAAKALMDSSALPTVFQTTPSPFWFSAHGKHDCGHPDNGGDRNRPVRSHPCFVRGPKGIIGVRKPAPAHLPVTGVCRFSVATDVPR